jgi:magnesium-transporting ATPase (P-type)
LLDAIFGALFPSRKWVLWVVKAGLCLLGATIITVGALYIAGTYAVQVKFVTLVTGWASMALVELWFLVFAIVLLIRTEKDSPIRSGLIGSISFGAVILVIVLSQLFLLVFWDLAGLMISKKNFF